MQLAAQFFTRDGAYPLRWVLNEQNLGLPYDYRLSAIVV
jgi:hypothetical protein